MAKSLPWRIRWAYPLDMGKPSKVSHCNTHEYPGLTLNPTMRSLHSDSHLREQRIRSVGFKGSRGVGKVANIEIHFEIHFEIQSKLLRPSLNNAGDVLNFECF